MFQKILFGSSNKHTRDKSCWKQRLFCSIYSYISSIHSYWSVLREHEVKSCVTSDFILLLIHSIRSTKKSIYKSTNSKDIFMFHACSHNFIIMSSRSMAFWQILSFNSIFNSFFFYSWVFFQGTRGKLKESAVLKEGSHQNFHRNALYSL